MFRNGIRNNIIKRKFHEISNFLNFIICNIVFFSFFPSASASFAPFIDLTYESQVDLYFTILDTLFPILFMILINVSGKPGTITNVVLPLLDDTLYNMVTWMIPLIVSFAYDDLMSIKIFSIINMCLHVICAVFAIIKWKRVAVRVNYFEFGLVFLSLVFVPVIAIPIFWITFITTSHFYLINMIFLVLFVICLVSFMSIIIVFVIEVQPMEGGVVMHNMQYILFLICFYAPNILQTLLITLIYPINYYFVKTWMFILALSLTRNASYFTDKVPVNRLATSTAVTQCLIRSFVEQNICEIFKEMQILTKDMYKMQKRMQKKIDEMQNEMKTIMDEIKCNENAEVSFS
ncbi:hypothetical protein RhiirA1_475366 [Rhizophagus irregularis]|uniref:Uncharacterized protein n=1 Tax=Rhizophagus irregularis TaxID=588596 RepID=A0A2N0QX53_9GLOM|nr:hypothetical protein RhiirA1_475366 [Rhizophagus irregularis]